MKEYQNFIGIDIGKFNFVVAKLSSKTNKEYKNNSSGIKQFLADYKNVLSNALVVMEATGVYELELMHYVRSETRCS